MRLDIHYIRKEVVSEPNKADIVDFVNAQLNMGLPANEIAKLVKETYFTQEIGDEERDSYVLDFEETNIDETTGLEQDIKTIYSRAVF